MEVELRNSKCRTKRDLPPRKSIALIDASRRYPHIFHDVLHLIMVLLVHLNLKCKVGYSNPAKGSAYPMSRS